MPYLIYNYHFWTSLSRCFLLIALLNCPLNNFWGLWSIHNIYGVLPPSEPEGRTCESFLNIFFQVKDMLVDCDMRKGDSCTGNSTAYDGIHLIYAGGHCHAPSCISMELFNADTGKLLCRHDPVYGQSDKVWCQTLIININFVPQAQKIPF